MYKKSKNRILFALFIFITILTIFILILSVYSSKEKSITEQYRISPNNVVYDKDYSYVSLTTEATLKKEWDGNYYLYENDNKSKKELGTEPVFYDKSKNQVTIYGTVYQVFSNGNIIEKKDQIVINNLNDFQFFKLSDRKYLIVGNKINNESFSTQNYLIVLIDKAGNATLLNNDVNIKTINPLVLSIGNVKFDIANEKIIIDEEEVDLKKINGSTNEYVKEEEDTTQNNPVENNQSNSEDNNTGNNSTNTTNNNSNSQIYNEIVNQIVNISGLLSGSVNKTNLYKNISLRSVNVGASYLDIDYSIIDPENKYLSVFLSLEDEDGNVKFYYLNKESSNYRISSLLPNKQYKVSINYIAQGNSSSVEADSIITLTSTDPTSVRVTKIDGRQITYVVKMYNEYAFASADVVLTNCENNNLLAYNSLNIENSLSNNGDSGNFILAENYNYEYICLKLANVKDSSGTDININSYHKVKIR